MRPVRLAGIVVAATLLAITPLKAQTDAITLTYATYLPQSFTFIQVDDWFMQQVTERTGGQVTFETFYGASLLPALDVYPGIAAGAADIGMGGPVYNVDMLPLSTVIQPFITEKIDAAAYAFVDLYQANDALRQEWESQNLHMLYALVAAENTFWTNFPIEDAASLQGKRLRATGGVAQALETLGAETIALAMQDGMQGLRTGAIDGFTSGPFDVSVTVGLHEIGSYGSDAGRMGVFGIVAMAINKSVWDDLPADVQQVMTEVAAEANAKYLEIVNSSIRAAVDELLATEDLQVVRPSEEENARWREETAQVVWDKWITDMADRGLDGQSLLDQFVALVRQYEAQSDYTAGFDVYMQGRAEQ